MTDGAKRTSRKANDTRPRQCHVQVRAWLWLNEREPMRDYKSFSATEKSANPKAARLGITTAAPQTKAVIPIQLSIAKIDCAISFPDLKRIWSRLGSVDCLAMHVHRRMECRLVCL